MKITKDDLKDYINKVGLDQFLSDITEFEYKHTYVDDVLHYRCSIVMEQPIKGIFSMDIGAFYCPYIPKDMRNFES